MSRGNVYSITAMSKLETDSVIPSVTNWLANLTREIATLVSTPGKTAMLPQMESPVLKYSRTGCVTLPVILRLVYLTVETVSRRVLRHSAGQNMTGIAVKIITMVNVTPGVITLPVGGTEVTVPLRLPIRNQLTDPYISCWQ